VLIFLASIDPTKSMKSISDVGAPIVQIKLTPVIRIIKRKDVQPNLGSKLYIGPGGEWWWWLVELVSKRTHSLTRGKLRKVQECLGF
jgi:hypothetical protein